MKSAVFYGRHDIRIENRPIPAVGAHDVLIQVKACGVCGTDVHIFEWDKGAAETHPPTVLGHEFSGVIADTGSAVTRYRKGDRVCVDPNYYCGACEFCRDGMAHYCTHMTGYGTTVDGAFAEYCAVNEKQVYPLGDGTSFQQGAMTEPVACCLHGMDMCEIRPGSHVAVIGGGMIGLIMVQLARLAGASRIALLEPVEGKRAVGKALGTDVCIDPLHEDVPTALAAHGMLCLNTVIECVGRPATIEQAIELAGPKAVVMMFGLTRPDEAIAVKPFTVFQKEIVLKASYINPYTQRRALDLIDSGRLDVTSMVHAVCGLDRLADILGSPQERSLGKFIIDPSL